MCFLLPVTLHMVFVFTLDELKKIEDKEKFPKKQETKSNENNCNHFLPFL